MPETTTADAVSVGELTKRKPLSDMTLEELANAANHDDERVDAGLALAELLRRTEADPKALIRAGYGDLSKLVAAMLVDSRFKSRPAHSKAVCAQHKLLRESLEGPGPTAIESMLAARAALDWLHLHVHELTYSMDPDRSTTKGREHLERVRDRLHRRYLASLRTLAAVQKLDLSGTTLIVGGVQQVNLPGVHRPPGPDQGQERIDVAVGQ